jgi:hypothetical protein
MFSDVDQTELPDAAVKQFLQGSLSSGGSQMWIALSDCIHGT